MKRRRLWMAVVLIMVVLTGCNQRANIQTNENNDNQIAIQKAGSDENEVVKATTDGQEDASESVKILPNLSIRFGETDDRPVYEIQLEDNEVSLAFVRVLQEREQTIPIYVFDGSENTDVLQFYDIPSSYNIPAGKPMTFESEQVGEVYYSAPSRIMIFYKDAQISGDYVKVGRVTTIEGLEEAVESNPLDAWKNKRVMLSIAE